MPSLTIKIGQLEIAYDGDQKFIENGLAQFIETLMKQAPPALPTNKPQNPSAPLTPLKQDEVPGHTTSMIAQIAGGGSGPELALAAIAHLALVKSMNKFTRTDILTEMKGATSFYKETFGGGNLTKYIAVLIKNKKLNPISDGVYSMPHSMRMEYSEKLKND